MKRFKVQTEDGRTLLLYYPTQAEAQKHWPDAVIEESHDQSHVKYVQRILDSAVEYRTVEHKGSTVYLLWLDTPVGRCIVKLFQDNTDGVWLDLCKYQLRKAGAFVEPIGWNVSNPTDFCKWFLFSDVEYSVLSSGRNHKKPKELSGVKKFASVSFGEKCKCQLFLKGDDLYINHGDYFSPMWRPPADDIGKPMIYYMNKYFGGTTKREKFIYADSWGAIVLRNRAWLRITNFVPMVKILNASQVPAKVWPLIRNYHKWPSYERNMDWDRFLEGVAGAVQKYLNKSDTTHR